VNLGSVALSVLVTVAAGAAGAVAAGPASAVAAGPDARPAAPPLPPLAQQLARIDQLHLRRDDRVAWSEEQALVQAAVARAPQDFGVLWRAARYYFWLSDDPGQSAEMRFARR